ncbi:inositol-3-phosphate synthase [Streptomyces xanthochromogenes]|uniref:inositol-3-phosphate synthase n=1 Tax=Streptomyces xanthochromogenes TaxID=67384 RepID=UPI00342A70C2
MAFHFIVFIGRRVSMGEIRVALAGIGSCVSSLVQTADFVRRDSTALNGIMYERIGGYRVSDMQFVAAFDVDSRKVGLDLAKAVVTPSIAAVLHTDIEPTGVSVEPGPLFDGIGGNLVGVVEPHPASREVTVDDVVDRLTAVRADVLVCLLPTGATEAVQSYARAAVRAGVAFINATPEPVVHEPALAAAFAERGVPLLGDDLRSHLGATTLHTALLELLQSRGLAVVNTYQLNVGGNTDFLNLADPARAAQKTRTKRSALQAAGIDASNVSAGPNGFVEYLGDEKVCMIRVEATSVLDSPLTLDIRMQVEDSPNATGVLVNAVRIAKTAAEHGHAGSVHDACAFLFKNPRVGATESVGIRQFRAYVDSVARD